jgi:hypothetical protein
MGQERLVASSYWAWNPLHTLRSLWGESRPRRGYLDVAALPEHLQRDMGFLDGNDPSCKYR